MDFPQVYVWLCVGAAVLIIELLGLTGGFLLGIGIAGFVTAAYVWLIDPDAIWGSVGLFSALSIVLTWAYWHYFRRINNTTDAPSLNHRAAQQIGAKFVLTEAVADIPISHFIGDTRWRLVAAEGTIAAGVEVVVRKTRGDGVLIVESTAN